MLEDAKTLGVPLPVATRTLRCFDAASRAGFGHIDGTQYPAWWIGHAAAPRQEGTAPRVDAPAPI